MTTLAAVEALCVAAKLAVTRVTLDGGGATVDVLPLTVVPETAIKRLYAAGAYQVNYGMKDGGEYFRLRLK